MDCRVRSRVRTVAGDKAEAERGPAVITHPPVIGPVEGTVHMQHRECGHTRTVQWRHALGIGWQRVVCVKCRVAVV
jgi:hypothetical protein